jgi:hypothetical protein
MDNLLNNINPKKIKYNMTSRRLMEVFNYTYSRGTEQSFFIDRLLSENLVKYNGQFYKPTQKLLELAFLPKAIIIPKNIRQVLTHNEIFTKEELIKYFGDDYTADVIVFWLKEHLYIYQSSDCRYRKCDKLCELLAEGEEAINTKQEREE